MKETSDYACALALLHKFNRACQKSGITKQMTYRGYDLLQARQQALFGKCKNFCRDHEAWLRRRQETTKAKVYTTSIRIVAKVINTGTLFLRPRSDVIVYSSDKVSGPYKNDFRINAVYEYLDRENLSYLEVFHTLSLQQLLGNLLRRKRLALYTVGFSPIRSAVPSTPDERESLPDEENLLFYLEQNCKAYAAQFPLRVQQLKKAIARVKPKTVLMIDDTRHYHELIVAARELSVKTIAVQHGHFTKYHVGWLGFEAGRGTPLAPDYLMVWSEYWKKELQRLGTYFKPDTILVGAPQKAHVGSLRRQRTDDTIRVLMPFETDAPHQAVKAYIDKLLEDESVEIYFKLRPDMTETEQYQMYQLTPHPRLFSVTDHTTVSGGFDVVLGTYSTFLYDMIEAEVPVGILDTNLDYGEGMLANHLAYNISEENLFEEINRALKIETSELVGKKSLSNRSPIHYNKILNNII